MGQCTVCWKEWNDCSCERGKPTCRSCGKEIKGVHNCEGFFSTKNKRIAALEEALALQKIALDHKTTLLESCETALQERDEQLKERKAQVEMLANAGTQYKNWLKEARRHQKD